MTPRPEVSVIVAARDSPDTVAVLGRALSRQTLAPERWELILVDDGSPEPLSLPSGVPGRLVRMDPRVGPYVARNRGVEAATGEVIAITDADCRPREDWLERLLARLRGDAMAGGAIEITVGPSPGLAEQVDAAMNLDQARYVELGFAAFANFACRRAVIDEVGPFNEKLLSNGDREFCMRAHEAGFTLGYASDAVIEHDPLRDVVSLAQRSFRLGRGRAQTAVHGAGPARERRRNWHPPASYLPSGLLGGGGNGAGRRGGMAVELASYALVGIPLTLGYAWGAAESRDLLPAARRFRT